MKRTLFPVFALGGFLAGPVYSQDGLQVRTLTVQPGVEVELEFTDTTVGGVRYSMEASESLGGWTEVGSDLPEILGTSHYGMSSAIGEEDTRGFFQIRSELVTATLGFEFAATEFDEGAGTQEVTVKFVDENGSPLIYNGPISYEWSGATDLVSSLTGSVMAGGTGAAIPLEILENLDTETLRQLTLKLTADAGNYEVDPAAASSTMTIRENDNFWRGGFVSGNGLLDLEFYVERNGGALTITLTDGTELLPTGAESVGAAAVLSDTTFHVEFPATEIPSTAENLVAAGTQLQLVLDADNATDGQSIGPDELAGSGTLTLSNPAKPHLETSVSGTFLVRKDPELQPDEDLPLE